MATPKTPTSLKKIKSGALSRGFALAKVSMSAGVRMTGHALGNVFTADQDKPERLKKMLMDQMQMLTKELGQLKGSLMKVGQLLSMYGEHFLPPEANLLLKSLQNQSPPLEWSAIEKVLKKQLGAEKLAMVEIDPVPIASASLGQVHRAQRKSDGRWLAMKVQYPGVDQAIEGDLKTLKSVLSVSKLIPRSPKLDEVFREVRAMLHLEVDYRRELEATDEFRKVLGDDPRLIVPETVPELSTGRVLTTTLEDGIPVDSPEVMALSQERRDALGAALLELYLRELLDLKAMQTDPHFGNYRIRLRSSESERDQIVLLDFGAVRRFSDGFIKSYSNMIRGAFTGDLSLLERGGEGLGLLEAGDSGELRKTFNELCLLIMEPFLATARYDWGSSDLPKRVARQVAKMALTFQLRAPPRELVFLDRKMGGVFIFLSVLKVQIDGHTLLQRVLDKHVG